VREPGKLASDDDLLDPCWCLCSFLNTIALSRSSHLFCFLAYCSYSTLHLLNCMHPHFFNL
jgi:hypothetical protein